MSHPFTAPAHETVVSARPEGPDAGLFLDVWFAPRRVVRTVLDDGGTYGVWGLAFLTGLAAWNVSGSYSPTAYAGILALSLVVAVPCGGLFMGLFGLMTYVGASLLGDRAQLWDLAIAVAWGSVPHAMTQIPPLLWMLGTGALGLEGPAVDVVAVGLFGVAVVGWFWSWVTVAHAVGEALGRSAWRGLLAYGLVGAGLTVLGLTSVWLLMAS